MYFLNLDFETASTLDLRACGAHRYAKHASTHVLCASYSLDGGTTVKRWRAWDDEPMPAELFRALCDRECLIRAWNAEFERLILKHVLHMDIDARRFRCTMARARSMALPGKLENVARALNLPVQKQDAAIMLKWCKPLDGGGWADDPVEYEKLCSYCDDDVRVEALASDSVREFSDEEVEDYAITAEINDAGIMIDRALANGAQRYATAELADICARIAVITDDVVTTPKQFARIKDWLQPRLPDDWKLEADPRTQKISFDKRAREELLDAPPDDFEPEILEFIELIDDAGRASTAKFKAMQDRADPVDDRVRGSYILNGAGQTNRFSAQGLQTQNMIRATLPDAERVIEGILSGVDTNRLIELARDDDDDERPDFNVLTILSRCLRPSIIAAEGKALVWGDWSAIEARVNPWLSNQPTALPLLDVFRRGEDVYIRQAMATFNCAAEDVDKERRQTGKVQILSFGFGGGVGAMLAMARAYGITMSAGTAEFLKQAWRASNPWGPAFWIELETAMMNAMRHPDTVFVAGRVQYMLSNSGLWCVLPSGRVLCYPLAAIEIVDGRFGPQECVTAMKASRQPRKGVRKWPRMKLWGGFACENITQAEAASLLRYGLRELRRQHPNDFDVIGHSHDEILREVPETRAVEAMAELERIMSTPPAWATGLPLAAECGHGLSYSK